MRHTKAPWSMKRRDSGWDILGGGRLGYGREIAVVFSRGDDVQQANAEHLVRAVNNHDALLDALRECVTELEAYEQDRAQRDICERARAAIAQAEGTHGS